MNSIFILLLMIFLHIVDDYYLQGWLASAKQKKYWQDNAPEKLYKYDYDWALIMHSFSWTYMYDNDNEIGKKELMNQIQEWNEDLAWYKANQKDFWIGIFIPNVFDQFEFINLGYQ